MNGFGKRTAMLLATLALGVALVAGCGEDEVINPTPQNPQHIAVRYILIGFNGSVPGVIISRSKAEAEVLADDVYAMAVGGEDFTQLMETYSDSPSRDTVKIANFGVMVGIDEIQRNTLQKGFTDCAFGLEPDSIGLAEYHAVDCPYGWFVIERFE